MCDPHGTEARSALACSQEGVACAFQATGQSLCTACQNAWPMAQETASMLRIAGRAFRTLKCFVFRNSVILAYTKLGSSLSSDRYNLMGVYGVSHHVHIPIQVCKKMGFL
jgi:hypothetical protein